jgi:hypothetical protein
MAVGVEDATEVMSAQHASIPTTQRGNFCASPNQRLAPHFATQ